MSILDDLLTEKPHANSMDHSGASNGGLVANSTSNSLDSSGSLPNASLPSPNIPPAPSPHSNPESSTTTTQQQATTLSSMAQPSHHTQNVPPPAQSVSGTTASPSMTESKVILNGPTSAGGLQVNVFSDFRVMLILQKH